jgi:NADPH:quinone reductase-like Zn-dependent oxidoreductase
MTMNAIVYRKYGGPEVLELVELPEPKVGQSSVLVQVKAAALNPADIGVQAGALDGIMDAWFPVIPGWDVAGVVEAVGPGVTEFRPGDEVIGFVYEGILRHGTYAERVAADVHYFARKPKNATWAQAAGLPLAGLTAYQSVVRHIKLSKGETLLIHGAGGSVGSLAAQIAVSLGARVIGSASLADEQYLESLGVEPVLYGDGLVERVLALTPAGVDAVFDCAGRGVLGSTAALHEEGVRVFSIADGGPGVTTIFARPDQADLISLVDLVEAERLVVRVAATYPLASAAAAQKALQQGRLSGKIILEPG